MASFIKLAAVISTLLGIIGLSYKFGKGEEAKDEGFHPFYFFVIAALLWGLVEGFED